jgi:predicted dehydrogenase
MTKPLRIGLLGASNLAVSSIIEPAKKLENVEVTMVAARDAKRASAYAATNNIPLVAASYDELIKSGEVDLVYICLPNAMHEEWGISALENNLNVLLEKPAVTNPASATNLLAAAAKHNCRLIEGFHYYYHPLFGAVRQLVKSGNMGVVKALHATLDVPMPKSENAARWDKSLGGGVMLDIGCYPVHWARHLVGEFEPTNTQIKFAETGVDEAVATNLKFENGASGSIAVSMTPHERQRYSSLSIELSEGAIEIRNLVLPHYGHLFRWRTGDEWHQDELLGETTYYCQLEAIRNALSTNQPLPTEGDDIMKNAISIKSVLDKQAG